MADRTADYVITLGGDDAPLRAIVSSFKSAFKSAASDIEASASKIELFKNVEQQVKDASTAFFKATDAAAKFRQQIAKIEGAGGTVGKELTAALAATEKQVASTSKEFNKQSTQLDKLRTSLTAAGVNVKSLATEQIRLTAELKAATAADEQRQARMVLGIKSSKEVEAGIAKINAALATLKSSGLGFSEYSAATAAAAKETSKLRAETGSLSSAFSEFKVGALAVVGATAGIGVALANARDAAREFANGQAAIGTVANVSKEQLDALGEGIRKVALEYGTALPEAIAATKAIIEGGIDPGDSLRVLDESVKASEASFTSLADTAKLSVTFIKAFGVSVGDLGKTFDQAFQASKDGGATLSELASSLGELAPIARGAKVPLTEVFAAIATLKKSGLDAPTAITGLGKAIATLATPSLETQQAMHALGIEYKGFGGTLAEVHDKALTLDQLRTIFPDARNLKVITSLTENFGGLTDEIERLNKSSGGIKKTLAELEATPEQQIKQFHAALADLNVQIGQFIGTGTAAVKVMTDLLNAFNNLPPATKANALEFTAVATAILGMFSALRLLQTPINAFAGVVPGLNTALASLTTNLTAAQAAMRGFAVAAAGFAGFEIGKQLYANSSAARQFGDALGVSASAVTSIAGLLGGSFHAALTGNGKELLETQKQFVANATAIKTGFTEAISGARERLFELAEQANELNARLAQMRKQAEGAAGALATTFGTVGGQVKAQLDQANQAIASNSLAIDGLVADLQKSIAALQQGAAQSITTIQKTAAEQIAALASRGLSQQQLAQQTLAIEQKSAADQLAVIDASQVQVLAAFDLEATAIREKAQRSGADQKRVELDLAIAKKGILQQYVTDYQAQLDVLVGKHNAYIAQVKTIELQRVDVNTAVDNQIATIRAQSLGAYAVYGQRIKEIEDLIGKARTANAAGESTLAETYSQQAISLAGNIGGAVEQAGRTIVTAEQSQRTQIGLLEQARTQYNTALDKSKTLAVEGVDATGKAIKDAQLALKPLAEDYAALAATVKEGLLVQIDGSTEKIKAKLDAVDEEIRKRDFLAPIDADLTKINEKITSIRTDLQRGIDTNLEPKTKDLEDAIAALQKTHPQIAIETADAATKIGDLKTSVAALNDIKVKIATNADEVKRVYDSLKNPITSKHTVDSNAPAVQAQIDGLKQPTESTHTVHIRTVNDGGAPEGGPPTTPTGFRSGGFVGGMRRVATAINAGTQHYQAFARGGPVFRMPTWMKVPGTGSSDTIPARLQAGSFVVRKAAAGYYGDGLMGALARDTRVRGYASGGVVTKDQVADWLKKNFGMTFPNDASQKKAGPTNPFFGEATPAPTTGPGTGKLSPDGYKTNQDYTTPPISFSGRPIPDALVTATNVISYAKEMLNAVGQTNPLLGSLGPNILSGIGYVERNPLDTDALKRLLQNAETIGANPYVFEAWGLTSGHTPLQKPEYFIDWLQLRGLVKPDGTPTGGGAGTGISIDVKDFASRFFERAITSAGLPSTLMRQLQGSPQRSPFPRALAGGGTTGDTVPAMLTPGEFVIKRSAADRYGSGLLNAINTMQIPRDLLAGMMAPPPMPRHFAEGGPVGDAKSATRGGPGNVERNTTININANAGDLLSEANVRRFIVPVIRDIEQHSR